MNTQVRTYLIEAARKKKIVKYQELCLACRLKLDMYKNPYDRKVMGDILGEISTYEHAHGRPLLTAIVLSEAMEEGDGFFKLCEQLGITGDWRRLKKDDVFVMNEINKCFDYWREEGNYKMYR